MRPTGKSRDAFTAELVGAEFFPAYDTFWWGAANDVGRFHVNSWYAYNWGFVDQPIIERIGSTAFIAFMGTASAPLPPSPTAINAQFDGPLVPSDWKPIVDYVEPIAGCRTNVATK